MPKQPNHASGQKDINELLAAMEADYNDWSRGFAPVMMGSNERPELVLELTNSFMRTNPAIAKHFARVTFFSDTRTELGFLTIPTLILQSAHDVIAPLTVSHYINEQLADSRLVVIETGGHCPTSAPPGKHSWQLMISYTTKQGCEKRRTVENQSCASGVRAAELQENRHASAALGMTVFLTSSPVLTAGYQTPAAPLPIAARWYCTPPAPRPQWGCAAEAS